MTVLHLLLKPANGAPMERRDVLDLDPLAGVVGGARCPPLRQVLLLSSANARAFGTIPGEFRETAIVDFDALNELPSGTELRIGAARVRLTFHCEPCSRVAGFGRPSALLHRRGYLGSVSVGGSIRVGDAVEALGRPFPNIPYSVSDRLAWYLAQRAEPIDATALLWELGLPRSYARALPALLKKMPSPMCELVRFKCHAPPISGSSDEIPRATHGNPLLRR